MRRHLTKDKITAIKWFQYNKPTDKTDLQYNIIHPSGNNKIILFCLLAVFSKMQHDSKSAALKNILK